MCSTAQAPKRDGRAKICCLTEVRGTAEKTAKAILELAQLLGEVGPGCPIVLCTLYLL